MIVISAVQSSTHTGIHNAILLIETSTMLAATKFIPQWVQQQWRIQDFPDGGQLPKCPISFIFMQFSTKGLPKNKSAHPSLGKPGSATEIVVYVKGSYLSEQSVDMNQTRLFTVNSFKTFTGNISKRGVKKFHLGQRKG